MYIQVLEVTIKLAGLFTSCVPACLALLFSSGLGRHPPSPSSACAGAAAESSPPLSRSVIATGSYY